MQSISGPTLTILSKHVCEDPTVVGWIFTGRSIGFIIGSIFPSWLEKCKVSQMLPLSLSVLCCGVIAAVMPILTAFWILLVGTDKIGLKHNVSLGTVSIYIN